MKGDSISSFIHPALFRLTHMRMRGRLSSMIAGFKQPRKLIISILGAVLAVVWLSNVVASILFREQYDPETLRLWMTLSLTVYAGWHFLRVSWQRPDASIEWSQAEQNNLIPSPFTRKELVQYRLVTVLGVTTLKAAIGVTLLLPDLPKPWLGFIALWFALALVELIRLISDTVTTGMSTQAYRVFRASVVFLVICLGCKLSLGALHRTQAGDPNSEIPIFFQFIKNFFSVTLAEIQSPLGKWISAPFGWFVELMTASTLSSSILLLTAAGISTLIVSVWILVRLDRWSEESVRLRDKDLTRLQESVLQETLKHDLTHWKLPNFIVRLCGGAVVWRQMVGLYRYGTGVTLSLIPPAILSVMPLFMTRLSDRLAIINFLGGLVFYSFLLLPAAMKFDFRRDYSHLLLLKMLPIAPWKIVVGQLATPVIVTTLFQYSMIAIACAVRGMDPGILIAALLSFPAMNFAVYGWENLMFLIFPQKLKQEGLEVFLRTTVIFTAKGIAFVVVFALLFFWALLSTELAKSLKAFVPVLGDHRLLFGIGVWCAVSCVGLLMTYLAARRFQSLDAFPESQTQ
ncbi:hypothetical protein [Thalassoglobus sp.]|uniref:hypothetical protein n=1 Tax=Thalassoglobus sp. TaxID=2795869 RepID=UPI003AA9D5BF